MMRRVLLGCRDRIWGAIQIARINTISSRHDDNKVLKPHYWNQEWRNVEELTGYLMDNLVYRDDHMVAFNKPNGVPMFSPKYDDVHDVSPSQPQDFLSINSCKNLLTKELGIQDMYGILSQNKNHSGVIIFCFDKSLSERMSHYFKNAKINKKCLASYDLVCVGKQTHTSGSRTLYIAQSLINNNLMSIEDDGLQFTRKMKISTTLFDYKLIKKSKIAFKCTVSHNQVMASIVKWDALELLAIRHLTPVLGDHKYSNRVQTILDKPVRMDPEHISPCPQNVPKDICDLLEVDQDSTSDIPLHIHCSKVILPKVYKSKQGPMFSRECLQNTLQVDQHSEENSSEPIKEGNSNSIIIKAPIPTFFTETLRRLQLL